MVVVVLDLLALKKSRTKDDDEDERYDEHARGVTPGSDGASPSPSDLLGEKSVITS